MEEPWAIARGPGSRVALLRQGALIGGFSLSPALLKGHVARAGKGPGRRQGPAWGLEGQVEEAVQQWQVRMVKTRLKGGFLPCFLSARVWRWLFPLAAAWGVLGLRGQRVRQRFTF